MIRFLCGCSASEENLKLQIDSEQFAAIAAIDEEGFLTCAIHKLRRYGWRIPTHAPMPNGLAGCSDLEWETFQVYGVKPGVAVLEITTTVPDLRDNRDPQVVGTAVLAERNGHS